MENSISIISCNYHSKKFAELLIKSIKTFSNENYPIYILDNSNEQELFTCDEYAVIKLEKNIGHGLGLDYLISNFVDTEYTLIFDIDAHIIRKDYDLELLHVLKNNPNVGLIAPNRVAAKPIHPGMMFFKTDDVKNKIPLKPFNVTIDDYKPIQMDVGQFVPMSLNQLYGKKTIQLKAEPPCYENVHGSTWLLNGLNTFYHFGYGTRLYDKTEFCGLKKSNIDNMQELLFKQIKF